MKKITLLVGALLISSMAFAQRYTTEIFTDSEIVVQAGVSYGVNFNPYADTSSSATNPFRELTFSHYRLIFTCLLLQWIRQQIVLL